MTAQKGYKDTGLYQVVGLHREFGFSSNDSKHRIMKQIQPGAALGELDDVIYQGEKTTDLAAAKAELDRMSPEAYAVKGFGSSIAWLMTEYMVAEIWEDEDGEQVIGDGVVTKECSQDQLDDMMGN